ncbi:hypothetical protein LB505_012003 [Fusarium chuoi]|nr:hypothetical protein LB505_012003 [Fusarium chuoi]
MGSIDRDLSSELSLEDAVNLLSGHDFWHTRANEALGLGSLKFSDGPNGVRGEDWINGAPSTAIPCGTALGASFDVELTTKLACVAETSNRIAKILCSVALSLHLSSKAFKHRASPLARSTS